MFFNMFLYFFKTSKLPKKLSAPTGSVKIQKTYQLWVLSSRKKCSEIPNNAINNMINILVTD